MRITICHRHEFGPETLGAIRELVQAVRILTLEEQFMTKTLVDLQADVERETAVDKSAVVLLNGLSQQIRDLKSSTTDFATLAAIDALAQKVESNTSDLSAAVAANTPAEPEGDKTATDPAADTGTDGA